MNYKRPILFCLILLGVFNTYFVLGCCGRDPNSLTELLVSTTDQRAILVVTVDSSWTDQQHGFRSVATVNKVYKHAPEENQIIIRSGSGNSSAGGHFLKAGEQYLLVSGSRDGKKYGGFVCDKFSRRLTSNRSSYRRSMHQMIFIKEYFEKVETKFTGAIRLEYEGKIYMEGFLKDGIPHGEFKHYETKMYGKNKDQHLIKSQATYVLGKLNGKTIQHENIYRRDHEIRSVYKNGVLLKKEYWYPGKTGLYLVHLNEHMDYGDFVLTKKVLIAGEDTLQSENSILNVKKNDPAYKFPRVLKNILHQEFRRYSKTGVLLEEGTYFWGARVGHWTWYHEDATIKENKFYETPVSPQDLTTIYYPQGAIKAQGKISQGLPEGTWKYFLESGELHFQNYYKNGLLNGPIRKSNKNYGSEFNFVDGKKHGVGKYFKNEKISSTEHYKNGKKDGLFQSFDKDGILRRSSSYQDDQLHGVQFVLSQEGDTTYLKNYTHGYLDGAYRSINKWQTEEGFYDMGFKIGVWKNYNSKKEYYTFYDYGHEKGTNIHYQEIDLDFDKFIYKDAAGNILSMEEIRSR